MNYIKMIIVGLVILGMVVSTVSTVAAMDEGDEAPKPETQYDRCAENTEHETNIERPNGVGDSSPKD